MSYMVVDLTESRTLDPRPFGKFGPFETEVEAEEFIIGLLHPASYFVLPSDQCK